MEKKLERIATLLIVVTMICFVAFTTVFIYFNSLQKENLELKNDLNFLESKVKIMEEVDEKIYVHLETLGGNDLMLQSWIEEINCYLYECRYEWSKQDGKSN